MFVMGKMLFNAAFAPPKLSEEAILLLNIAPEELGCEPLVYREDEEWIRVYEQLGTDRFNADGSYIRLATVYSNIDIPECCKIGIKEYDSAERVCASTVSPNRLITGILESSLSDSDKVKSVQRVINQLESVRFRIHTDSKDNDPGYVY